LPAGYNLVVGLLVIEENLLEDSGVLEVAQGAVDGGSADFVVEVFEAVDELLGLEEAFFSKDGVEDHGAFGGEFELLLVQIASENGADGFVGECFAGGFRGDSRETWEDVGGLCGGSEGGLRGYFGGHVGGE
jgi:hypothetical protein